MDIIHRDLKPENLLVCGDGYLKLTDFGFAKKLTFPMRTWTLCGTPDYMAPEVIASKGHGKGVDWWTLGVLLFEMITGYAPFNDRDVMTIYSNILSATFTCPAAHHITRDARSISK
jgi:serine/threonine protein kinase